MIFPSMFKISSPSNPLNQGDIFIDETNEIVGVEIPYAIGYLILTYTCDLNYLERISYIQSCPIMTFHSYLKLNLTKRKREIEKGKRALQDVINETKSQIVELAEQKSRRYFLLSPIEEFNSKHSIADISLITSTHIMKEPQIRKKRVISLKSPWRERVGFMAGHLFNRIALDNTGKNEIDIVKDHFDKVATAFLKNTKSDSLEKE